MTYTLITEEELDRLFDSQFNPPRFTVGFSEDDFYNEWKSVRADIKSALLELGFMSCNDGGDDYTVADDWGYSRHHEVEIHRERMFDKKLLPTIRDLLKTQPEDHEVVVLHDLFLRREIEPFHIILRRNQILAETDDPKLLKRLGLEA